MSMARGARTLVETCAGVRPGESVVVVADHNMVRIGQAVAAMCFAAGAKAELLVASPREIDGQEPSRPVAAALSGCDVFFAAVERSITHTQAVVDAVTNGARGLMLTHFTEDMLISGGIEADFPSLAPVCHKMAETLEQASHIRLSTPAGTDLTFGSAGRRGNALTCIVSPGQFSPVPTIEANTTPVEGTAQGVIVADGSIPYAGIGLLTEPVIVEVVDGTMTKISGGHQATLLREAYESKNDPLVYNVAELGVGLNPKCKFTGIMLEDEGVYGTVHIGTGTNITLGGNTKAACHYDLIMLKPTITADGRVILKDGEVAI
jgi:2,5-dihydroxypyridine 5,6-dioxygenase